MRCSISPGSSVSRLCLTRGNFILNCYLPVLTQVFDQPDEMETGGMYFPMAIDNLCECCFIKNLSSYPILSERHH